MKNLIVLIFLSACSHLPEGPDVRTLRDNECYTLRSCTEEMSLEGIKICNAESKKFERLTTGVDAQGTYIKFKCL